MLDARFFDARYLVKGGASYPASNIQHLLLVLFRKRFRLQK